MTLEQIKTILRDNPTDSVLQELANDSRTGVKKLLASYYRQIDLQQQEQERLRVMYKYERDLYNKGLEYIAGVDEAGRGPLAGPLVVAAVILPKEHFFSGLNDSKKVSEKTRERLYEEITKQAITIKVEIISSKIIDEINIYQATILGMQRVLTGLQVKPEAALIDAMPLTNMPFYTISLVHGDSLSASIAAASIIAKVTRDRIMGQLDTQYQGYGFSKNKGYGTKEHLDALVSFGFTPEHRVSFEPLKGMISGGNTFEYSRNASTDR